MSGGGVDRGTVNRDVRHGTRDTTGNGSVPSSPASRIPSLEHLVYAYGGPLAAGVIRAQPEDFIVREYLGFVASGDGEHILLTVRKRGANSKWVAQQIAAHAGVRVRDVGLSGLKDRHAVTEQSFTVPAYAAKHKTTPETWLKFHGDGFEVVAAARQRRKLSRGAHRGNEFELVVRELHVDPLQLDERLRRIAKEGVPNYFGAQRFGHDERNLRVAEDWFCRGIAPSDREQRGFALSAARSALFNTLLSDRVSNGVWNIILPGEVVNLDGSGSVFVCAAPDVDLLERCARLDVHPTGPLCGSGDSRVQAEALEIENRALAPWREWIDSLIALRVEQQRRALRLAVHELHWTYAGDTLTLRFRLTRGAFATAVLREIAAVTNAAAIGAAMGDE